MSKSVRNATLVGVGVLLGFLAIAVLTPAHALPEYGSRTGQPCTTCHVNPAGGGQRTLRGLLWVAQGRPDQVPDLPSAAEEPGTATEDDQALYTRFGCGACHGARGEGGVGPALNQDVIPAEVLSQVIRNGQGAMLGYSQDTISDAELEAIVRFVRLLGEGKGPAGPILEQRFLAPPQLACGGGLAAASLRTDCGGN